MISKELVEMRDRWLAAGQTSEFLKNSEVSANLYNQRPTWLDLAPKKPDDAVFSGYGWPEGLIR